MISFIAPCLFLLSVAPRETVNKWMKRFLQVSQQVPHLELMLQHIELGDEVLHRTPHLVRALATRTRPLCVYLPLAAREQRNKVLRAA